MGPARKTAVPSEVAESLPPGFRPGGSDCASASRKASAGRRRSAVSCRVKMRGLDKVHAAFVVAMAAYNIVRLPKLLPKLLAPRGEVRPAT